jgi:hypothetical protein
METLKNLNKPPCENEKVRYLLGFVVIMPLLLSALVFLPSFF